MSPNWLRDVETLTTKDQEQREAMARGGQLAPASQDPVTWAIIINADACGLTPRLGLLHRYRLQPRGHEFRGLALDVRQRCVRLYVDCRCAAEHVQAEVPVSAAEFDVRAQTADLPDMGANLPCWTLLLAEWVGLLAGHVRSGAIMPIVQQALLGVARVAAALYHSPALGAHMVSVPA